VGFPASRTGTINNNSSDVTFSAIVTSADQGSAEASGFFLQSGFSYQINSGLTARATAYTLNLAQIFTGDATTYSTSIPFYVDSLPPGIAPSFVSTPSITNGSTTASVTGVPIVNGAWSLTVGSITTNNVAYYFSASPVLTYSFAGSATTPMIATYVGTGQQQNTLSGSTVMGSTAAFYYQPQITLTLKNINNLTAASTQTVNAIIDAASVTLIGRMTSDSAPNGSNIGHLMNSPDLSQSTSNDWTTAHTAVNQSATIVGTNNLQIMNGAFVSKSRTLTAASAYQNYTGLGPDYSGIGTTGYRWATFRWYASNGIPISLQFKILGLGGGAAPTTKNATAPYVNNMLVFYRIENLADNNGTPSNVANPANDRKYSTVWINANYLALNFSQLYATTANTLTFGGLPNGATDITITGSTITYNVLSPTETGTSLYIYLAVGLPMSQDIAFTGAYSTVT
jgi:hypothetical protein